MSKLDNDATLARLVAALEELPIADPEPDWKRVPNHQFIMVSARELMIMQRRNFSRSRARQGRNELEKIQTAWIKAVDRLSALYDDDKATDGQLTARELFGASSKAPWAALLTGRDLLENIDVQLKEHTPGHHLHKNAAVEIVAFLAQQYERLTGAAPRRRVEKGRAAGPFFVLVKKVFSALSVTSSAENAIAMFMEKPDYQKD